MYLVIIAGLMGVLPVLSILVELLALGSGAGLVALVGKWFVFWAVGVRLALAGLKQVSDPAYTAGTILGVKDEGAYVTIRELGFANLSIGLLGILSILAPAWVLPAAIVGACFLGLAGVNHAVRGGGNRAETIAMISDLAIAALLVVYIACRWLGVA